MTVPSINDAMAQERVADRAALAPSLGDIAAKKEMIGWIRRDLDKIEGFANALDSFKEHTARQRRLLELADGIRGALNVLEKK